MPSLNVTLSSSGASTPVPSPPAGGGTVYFDGRAKNMTVLYCTSAPGVLPPVADQQPAIWTTLSFTNNDITLVSDARYTKAYKIEVATGDTNPWGGSSTDKGAGQLTVRRDTPTVNPLGQWDWYAFATRVDAWNGPITDLFFCDITSFGYQTSSNDQISFRLWNGNDNLGPLAYGMFSNAGYAEGTAGSAIGSTNYEEYVGVQVVFGQWEEWVLGVKWSTTNDGEVQLYHKTPPSGAWSRIWQKQAVSTELWGPIGSKVFEQDGSNWTTIDKIGLYFKEYGGESETIYMSGMTRCSDLATAQGTLP